MNTLFSHLLAFLLGVAACTAPLRSAPSPKTRSNWAYAILGALHSLLTPFNFKSASLRNVKADLLDMHQVVQKYDETTWQRQAYETFGETLMNKSNPFPCIYGTKGFKANELDYLFVDSEDLSSGSVSKIIAKSLIEYHRSVHQRGKNVSLVVMSPPPVVERTVNEYHQIFWSLLVRLRKLDPKPWPKDIPMDTEAQHWCFNFDDTSSFIGVLTPAHSKRQSRYAANLCLIYQPRYIFDRLFTTQKNRDMATATVRALVDKYDDIPHSPDISNYAEPGTTESRQYFLLDENIPAICPVKTLESY